MVTLHFHCLRELTYTVDNVTKLFTGELSNVTPDTIATSTLTWQVAQVITDNTINYQLVEETVTYINESGVTVEIGGKRISFGVENENATADGVTVTIENDSIKTITGLDDGESVSVHSNEIIKRENGGIHRHRQHD